MIFILNCLFLLVISLWAGKKMADEPGKTWYGLTLLLKISAGLVLGVIYWYWLGEGDTIQYFYQASEMASLSSDSLESYLNRLWVNEYAEYKGESRTEFFTKILSVLLIITNQNYWLAAAYLSLFNFLCCWYLVQLISKYLPTWKWPAMIAFLLVPSIVLWSSGVLKDSLANGTMVLLFAFMIKYHFKLRLYWWEYPLSALALVILIKLKFYVAALIIIALVLLVVHQLVSAFIQHEKTRWWLIGLCLPLLILLVSFMDYNLQLNHLPASITTNYQLISGASDPSHVIHFDLQPNWSSILLNLPKSLVYGLFGPFPLQGGIIYTIYWIENLVLLVLFLFSFRMLFASGHSIKTNLLMWLSFGFILIMAGLLPLASPNFGTLMRYKAAFLPLLWMLLTYIPFQKILKKKSA